MSVSAICESSSLSLVIIGVSSAWQDRIALATQLILTPFSNLYRGTSSDSVYSLSDPLKKVTMYHCVFRNDWMPNTDLYVIDGFLWDMWADGVTMKGID